MQIIDTSGSAFKPKKEYEHKGPITFGALKFVSMNMRAIMCFLLAKTIRFLPLQYVQTTRD